MKSQELKEVLQSCHDLEKEGGKMKQMVEDLQSSLEEKNKALRKTESERDLYEKEKVLLDTQIKVGTTNAGVSLISRFQANWPAAFSISASVEFLTF